MCLDKEVEKVEVCGDLEEAKRFNLNATINFGKFQQKSNPQCIQLVGFNRFCVVVRSDEAEESGGESAGDEDKDDADTYSKKKKKKQRGKSATGGGLAAAAASASAHVFSAVDAALLAKSTSSGSATVAKRSANLDKLFTVFPLSCKVTFDVGGKGASTHFKYRFICFQLN